MQATPRYTPPCPPQMKVVEVIRYNLCDDTCHRSSKLTRNRQEHRLIRSHAVLLRSVSHLSRRSSSCLCFSSESISLSFIYKSLVHFQVLSVKNNTTLGTPSSSSMSRLSHRPIRIKRGAGLRYDSNTGCSLARFISCTQAFIYEGLSIPTSRTPANARTRVLK